MRHHRPMLCVVLSALALFATNSPSQTPTQIGLTAGSSLSGTVRDINGALLADVSVTLMDENMATRTDSLGHFEIRDVPPGGHTVLFRRIGYRSTEYRWVARPGDGLQIDVVMTLAPSQLSRVVIEASGTSRRHGTSSIGGTVSDSAGLAVSDADVRLLGAGLSTVTDSTGRFEFQMLAAGSYIVRTRKRGLMSSSLVMQLVDDDSRGITIKLFGLPKNTKPRDIATASGYGITDAAFEAFDRRERGGSGRATFGPADLFRANHAPLDFLLQQYRDVSPINRGLMENDGIGSTPSGDCLLINGRRAAYQPLRSFTSVDVQLVEVFRPHDFVDQFLISEMEMLPECRGSVDHHPSYFVLWTRSLR